VAVALAPGDRRLLVERLRAAGCVFAEDEAVLLICEAPDAPALACLVERRVAGEPLEHVLGWARFAGLRVAVGPGVFVPRRRSEVLVDVGTALLRQRVGGPSAPVLVDLCCGSGAVGLALATAGSVGGDRARLWAVDIDPAAVRCAAANLAAVGGQVLLGDLDAPLPAELRGQVDLLTANVPYVPTRAIALLPTEAREHEPRVALDGGPTGLDVARAVAARATRWLSQTGHLLIESSQQQAAELTAVLAAQGLSARVVRSEELDVAVVVGALAG
jgi:release factor glutamine methyltransferase